MMLRTLLVLFVMAAVPLCRADFQGALSAMQNTQGVFTQRVTGANGYELEFSRGTVLLGSAGAFRWVYEGELAQEIIADGDSVWIIDRGLDQVIIKSQSEDVGDRVADILVKPEAVTQIFDVHETEVDGGFSAELMPLDHATASFEIIKVHGSDSLVHAIEIFDQLGNRTLLEFSEIEAIQTEPSMFSVDIDSEMDVIDERGN